MVDVEFLLAPREAEFTIIGANRRTMTQTAKPSGPSRLQMLFALPRLRRELVEYLYEQSLRHGEVVLLPLRLPTYMLSNPDDIKHILVTNPRNYHKTGGLTVGRELFGDGLVSSEVPLHTRQRRLMQPMFHRNSIANFAELMVRATTEHIAPWRDGATVDLSIEMMQLTLTIVGRALFSVDLCHEAGQLGRAFTVAQRLITRRQQRVPIPVWVPTPTNIRYRTAIRQINESIAQLVAERRKLPEAERPNDLLTMLLAARFEDGTPMPEQQLRDEVVTLMMAGHETVANSLIWTWFLLGKNPEVEASLLNEWRTVLGNRPPTLADVPNLKYTEMVFSESRRLYPPAWTLARRVLKEDKLPSGMVLPAGCEALMTQYICHRNAKYFPEPHKFDPERFNPDRVENFHTGAYFPFGSGPRFCIGEAFAKLESILVMVVIGRNFQFQVDASQRIGMEPLITLRPRFGMRMKLKQRPEFILQSALGATLH